jgi:hypothetical protein
VKGSDAKKVFDESLARRSKLFEVKNNDYSREEDVLANFKRCGAILEAIYDGPRPPHVKYLASLFVKHLDAWVGYLAGTEQASEGIMGRVDDMRVYLDLFELMEVEGSIKLRESFEELEKAERVQSHGPVISRRDDGAIVVAPLPAGKNIPVKKIPVFRNLAREGD